VAASSQNVSQSRQNGRKAALKGLQRFMDAYASEIMRGRGQDNHRLNQFKKRCQNVTVLDPLTSTLKMLIPHTPDQQLQRM